MGATKQRQNTGLGWALATSLWERRWLPARTRLGRQGHREDEAGRGGGVRSRLGWGQSCRRGLSSDPAELEIHLESGKRPQGVRATVRGAGIVSWAAVTKDHRSGGLNNRNISSFVLGITRTESMSLG